MGFDEKDYKEPIFLVYYLRSLARNIGIDVELMKDRLYRDDIDHIGPRLRQYWDKEGIPYNDSDTINCDTAFNTVCEWARYKKIYDFHPAFTSYLKDTEDAPIYSNVLAKLPFQSFYINLGRFDAENKSGAFGKWIRGMFVRVLPDNNCVYIGVTVESEMPDGEWVFLSHRLVVENGKTFRETMQRQKTITQNGRNVEMIKSDWGTLYRIAVNACQYLCASNAEVKDVKTSKGKRPIAKIDGKDRPVAIQRSEVGYRLGQKFEKMYRKADGASEVRSDSKTRIPVRPHVRRAHWHHYWTGPGKTVLELRWLEPVFVMGDPDKMEAVVHEVTGEKIAG